MQALFSPSNPVPRHHSVSQVSPVVLRATQLTMQRHAIIDAPLT